MDYSAIIDRLEDEIRLYRVEYQRFFNGEAKVPPEEYSAKIRQRIHQLTAVGQLSQVDRFRLGGLEGRFNSLSDLFRRRLRDMDIPHQITAPNPPTTAEVDPSVVVGESSEPAGIGTLFNAIFSKPGTTVAMEDFHAYLLDQAAKVRQRTGCTDVRFTVRTDGGKKRLKARPMPAGDAE